MKKVLSDFSKEKSEILNSPGSVSSQIIFLNSKIKSIIEHLRNNRKDVSAKRAMLKFIPKSKKLLKFLKDKDNEKYLLVNSIVNQ